MRTNPNRNHIPHSSPTRDQGFTLVELLVVITIIVVLATLAVFMTRNIRDKAHQANAMSSLRQVAAFNVAYSTENNGDINTMRWVGDPKEGGPGGWAQNSFWGRLQPFFFPDVDTADQRKLKDQLDIRLDKVLNSSDANKMTGTVISGAKIYHDGSGLPVPYGFNSKLMKWNQFIKTSSIDDPSQILYMVYGHGFFDKEDGQVATPMALDGSAPKNNIYYLAGGKALAAFLDGRVEAIQAPIPDRNFE